MVTAECPDCAAAAIEPHWGFRASCRGCCARSIARSPQFFEARKVGGKAGLETRAYRALLAQVGALFDPPVSHEDVLNAAGADASTRRAVA